jgi:hypothetical protein
MGTKRKTQAAKQSAYERKIASLRLKYLERKAAKPLKEQSKKNTESRTNIKNSVPRLIASVPTRTHFELLEMYKKCCAKMAVRNRSATSAAIASLHEAILDEWDRRARSLLAEDGYFEWPTTDAPLGDGAFSASTWRSVGMLSALGYHVGVTEGLPAIQRRFLLDQMFEIRLPPLNDARYMLEWGAPRTAGRLQKLAETIAALTRNAKRRTSQDLHVACDDWELDLDYLYAKYYVGHFRFSWPLV